MIFQQIVENIREVFPDKTETQVKIDINTAQKAFAQKTRCNIKDADLTLNGTLILSYPSDMIVPVSIQAFDAATAGNKLDDILEWTVTRGKVELIDLADSDSLTMPADVKRLSMKYSAYPAALTTDTQVPDLPSEFHEALEYAILAKYAQKAGKWQQARELNNMLRQKEHDAQEYAATQFIGGWASVEPSEI